MQIGSNIKQMRVKLGLTQEELASRTELSKGFISQLERDLTSPSIATLVDILEALGTNLKDFFNERPSERVVYSPQDIFEKVDEQQKTHISWLIPNAQSNAMEPIMVTIEPGGSTTIENPHEGEEFGYILYGWVVISIGSQEHKARKGDSFYFRPSDTHSIANIGKKPAALLWVCTPPTF